ncbi:hypothetical protein ACK8HY_05865 [Sphingobacterium sp. NGMCC 1.201703]|uniref:hypothetical protein n=1 Tax=Sphingobacterium sp. NGMCC 1.201703 TaxID=3388657 RepID=UPI0039FC9F39
MKKSILKMMLLGGVIFGASQVKASTIAEEAPIVQSEAMVEQEGPIQCLVEVAIRGEQMEGHYPSDVLDRILEMEMEKCLNGTHSSL